MRPLLLAAFAALCACGPTGPHTVPGLEACDQLRECLCDPERTADQDTCQQNITSILQFSTDPDRTCASLLQFSCGRPLQVDPPTL